MSADQDVRRDLARQSVGLERRLASLEERLDEECRRREWLDSDLRRLIERVEALEASQ